MTNSQPDFQAVARQAAQIGGERIAAGLAIQPPGKAEHGRSQDQKREKRKGEDEDGDHAAASMDWLTRVAWSRDR